jgi:hypothetical protein
MPRMIPLPAEHTVMAITPDTAENWLEHRNLERNRKYSRLIEAKYAAEIRAGLWKTSPQGVSFDRDGFILDGQHRLGAIAKTGITTELFVSVGWDPDCFDVLDSGYKRATAQMIVHPHSKLMTSAGRYLGAITGQIRTGMVRGGVYVHGSSGAEILRVVNAWPELGTFAASAQHIRSKAQIIAAPHLAVLAQASRSQYCDRIPMWLDGLAYGDGLTGVDPRLHLRKRFAEERRALANAQAMAYGLIVTAWNAYATKTPMPELRACGEDSMPEVVQ